MLNFHLTQCKECGSVDSMIASLDKKISFIANRKYNAVVFLHKNKVSKREAKTLLFYKEILLHLKWNKDFYGEKFEAKRIISRIKSLI